MRNTPDFQVPSPAQIHDGLFTSSQITPPTLPASWWGNFLLTPAGGLSTSPLVPSDQLVVAQISYTSTDTYQGLRTRLFLLEGLSYYDFYFETAGGATVWYWLVSDPSTGTVTNSFGPFSCAAQVPVPDFLSANGFAYAGTWNVIGNSCDSYAAQGSPKEAGTWFSFSSGTSVLQRIMNVDSANDFGLAVLGAYYFANCSLFQVGDAGLTKVRASLPGDARNATASSPMVTLLDLQTAMMSPPPGAGQVPCTMANINQVIAGISFPTSPVTPPSWSDQVQSNCYMIGQDPYPYYCQIYYDWTFGEQISVFVTQNTPGVWDARQDMVLPKGKVGPAINYAWNDAWTPQCTAVGQGIVPMPVPGFVQAGGGQCRATFTNDPYFPDMTIWSIKLGDGDSWANFWDWFDTSYNGIVFSLAPAISLTLIDYQTFVRNAPLGPSTFAEPNPPPCGNNARAMLGFMPPMRGSQAR